MFTNIPRVSAGDAPSAEWANKLVDAVNKFLSMRVDGSMAMVSVGGCTMLRSKPVISDITVAKLTRNLLPLQVCQAQQLTSISVTIPSTIPGGSDSYGSVSTTFDSGTLINVADMSFIDEGEMLVTDTIVVAVKLTACAADVWFVIAASKCETDQPSGS